MIKNHVFPIKNEVLSDETLFHWIGRLFRRIGPRVTLGRTLSKINDPILKKHPVDVAIVTPFSSSPRLVAAASARPSYMAKGAEKIKFDRYPRVNLVPFYPGDHRAPWIPCREVHQLPRERRRPPLARHP